MDDNPYLPPSLEHAPRLAGRRFTWVFPLFMAMITAACASVVGFFVAFLVVFIFLFGLHGDSTVATDSSMQISLLAGAVIGLCFGWVTFAARR